MLHKSLKAFLVLALTASGLVAAQPGVSASVQATPAIAHRSTTSGGIITPGTSLALVKPAGTVAGDVLVAQIANRDSVATLLTPPDGWTQANLKASAGLLKSWVFTHVAGAAEPASYTFTLSAAYRMAGTISAFSGVDNVRPVDTIDALVNGNTATFTGKPITVATGNALAVWFGVQLWTGSTCPNPGITQPAGFTEAREDCLASPANGLLYDAAYRQLGTPLAQPAWTGSSPFANTNIVQSLALRPIAGAQVADNYSPTPATVGYLWDGLNPDGSKNTAIAQTVLYQPSGLAASRINPTVQYLHSEKDRQTMVAVDTGTAQVVGKYTVTIPNVFDWEDIATGPCPAGTCFFAGDIGTARDIPKPNGTSSVVRVKEPDLAAGETSGTLTGDYFPYTMPGGAKNAEALLVHPVTGDIYVITKAESGISDVYKFPNPLPAPGTSSLLTKVATLTLPTLAGDINYAQLTAASIHPASNRFLVRTYRKVYEYRGTPGGSFESALTGTRVALTDTSEGQGESIEYAADGSGYFTVSESAAAPYALKRVDRR